ncbi:ABC transporter G family member 41-like isoform X2 [Iris pallida]|uniref:ABC transporter G family member 41-like isoform X2 n=1 Tax=Iris pallida TaxID=29817 RepID=A0AAX6E486_IRIPA|nr:ABC transporter G family member 41-like isoform X2 [Iris pallida]
MEHRHFHPSKCGQPLDCSPLQLVLVVVFTPRGAIVSLRALSYLIELE